MKKKWLKAIILLVPLALLLFLTACTAANTKSGSGMASAVRRINNGKRVAASSMDSAQSPESKETHPLPVGSGTDSQRQSPASPAPPVSSGPERLIAGKGVRVLLYHDIMTPAQKGSVKNGLVMTTDDFDRQMHLLKEAGYQTASMDDLYAYIAGKKDLSHKIVLTFDDGYRTNGYLAAPILKKYGFTATVFIITKFLDMPDGPVNTKTFFPLQYLNNHDLPRFSDTLAYASHTDDMHDDYKGRPMLVSMPAQRILKDLQLSRSKLSGTAYFAYPFGKYSQTTIRLLKESGFTMAFTTRPGSVYPGTDLYRVPRYEINAPITDRRFESIAGITA